MGDTHLGIIFYVHSLVAGNGWLRVSTGKGWAQQWCHEAICLKALAVTRLCSWLGCAYWCKNRTKNWCCYGCILV